MRPDRAFLQDLVAIDPNYFVAWDPEQDRWQVREWVTENHFSRDAHYWMDWAWKSVLVTTVCFRDDSFHDIGFKPLDQRTILSVNKSRRNSEDPDFIQKEVDDHNERLAQKADEERDLASRDMAKRLWHHYREPTVYLGQKGAR